jgi:hypothetical protein
MARMKRLNALRPKKRRWGRLAEIGHIKAVPSTQFNKLPNRLKHLAAWRRMHTLGSHASVRGFGTQQRIRPSSNLPLRKKLAYIKKRA